MWKEAVVAYFKVLLWSFTRRTEENYEIFKWNLSVFWSTASTRDNIISFACHLNFFLIRVSLIGNFKRYFKSILLTYSLIEKHWNKGKRSIFFMFASYSARFRYNLFFINSQWILSSYFDIIIYIVIMYLSSLFCLLYF